ncbi:unnamed protein product [Durusdinium trenchii]|uniref:Uncharacterized protein n=1 Tax=Durusdinium trenchii TaxID=1381693 RepID=A0ABP0IU08_9DINO
MLGSSSFGSEVVEVVAASFDYGIELRASLERAWHLMASLASHGRRVFSRCDGWTKATARFGDHRVTTASVAVLGFSMIHPMRMFKSIDQKALVMCLSKTCLCFGKRTVKVGGILGSL